MNIKELADIGARAAFNLNAKHLENFAEELTVGPLSLAYSRQQPAREAFAQAVIDAYRKSVDEPAPVKEKWAEEKTAFAKGLKIEYRSRYCNGVGGWELIGEPSWLDHNEYRIAPSQESNESAFDQERRFHAETKAKLKDLERWKQEQLEVESTWDDQAVAKEIGLTVGKSIRPAILPFIQETKAKLKECENQLQYIGDICDNQDGGGTVAKCIERKVLRLYREHDDTNAKLASAEAKLAELVKAASFKIAGMTPYEYLCYQFPAVVGHSPFRVWFFDLNAALPTVVDEERQEFEAWMQERGDGFFPVTEEACYEIWKAARNTK